MTDSASLHRVRIQHEDVDLNAELDRLAASTPGVGALVSFVGTVRGANDGSAVSQMTLEHYPGMTEASIAAIIDAAFARWSLVDALVVHRVGALPAGARIVLVIVAAAHRGEAFAACEFIMDYLKTHAPFWKKEHTPDGARWVDARATDDAALKKWTAP